MLPSTTSTGFRERVGVRFAFDDLNLHKLRINVFDYTEKAKHVLASRGFVQEGKLARDFYREGGYHDIVILSIFREVKE
jgi:RimJ/RimL family protein N-acetyltransferase